jgi:hypothetical protein
LDRCSACRSACDSFAAFPVIKSPFWRLDFWSPPWTVKNHITAILRKLGVSSRVEAVLAAGALGWIARQP